MAEFESNDARASASSLPLGTPTTGQLSTPADVDYFRVTASVAGLLNLSFDRPNAVTDSYLYSIQFEDANGVVLAQYRDSADPQVFPVRLPQAGDYFVRIASASGYLPNAGTDAYALTASLVAGDGSGWEIESNNSRATANALAFGGTANGQLLDANDIDYYAIAVTTPGVYALSFDGPANIYSSNSIPLQFEDAAGRVLDQFRAGDAARTFNIAVRDAGTYYVKIGTTYASHYIGDENPYHFMLAAATGDAAYEIESNDTRETANPLVLGATIHGHAQALFDYDYFSVTLPSAGLLTLNLAREQFSSGYNIRVEDASGNAMATYADLFLAQNSVNVGLLAGTYYVRLSAINSGYANYENFYTLSPTFVAGGGAGYETEPNDTRATANALAAGVAVQAQFAWLSDVDYFAFTAATPGIISVRLDRAGSDYAVFRLEVENAAGTRLAGYDAGNDLLTYRIGAAEAGTYYVRLSNGQFSDPFTLTASLSANGLGAIETEPNNSRASADSLTLGGTMSGQAASGLDEDYYFVSVGAAGLLNLAFVAPGTYQFSNPSFSIKVEDADGHLIAGFHTTLGRTYQVALQAGGTYFVVIAADRPSDPYQVTATFSGGASADFETENNDTRASADAIALATTIKGQLSSAGDVDYYALSLVTSGVLSLDFKGPDPNQGTAFNFLLRLENAAGEVLAQYTDPSQALLIPLGITGAGTYFIAVAPSHPGFSYQDDYYTLRTTFAAGSAGGYEHETNQTPASANPAALGQTITGQLASATDIDYYTVAVGTAGILGIGFDSPDAVAGAGRFSIRIEDANGLVLADFRDYADPQAFAVGVAGAGTYYVRIASAIDFISQGADHPYGLTLSHAVGGQAGYESEFNDTPVNADTPGDGAFMIGQLSSYADVDVYAFTASASRLLTVVFDAPASTSLKYFEFTLQDGAGNQMARIETSGDLLQLFTGTAGDTYYVSVGARNFSHESHYHNSAPYRVAVIADDYTGSAVAPGTLAPGASLAGDIQWDGDRDWLRTTLLNGVRYVIDLKGASSTGGTLSDPSLGVLSSNGDLLFSADGGGTGTDARLYFTPTISGEYFIEARHAGAGTGTYQVALAQDTDDYSANAATTGSVAMHGLSAGNIERADDRDLLRIQLDANGVYQFDLKGASSGSGSLADPRLLLLDARLNPVADNADGAGGVVSPSKDAQIVFVAPDTGTYYLAAQSQDGGTGNYKISAVPLAADYYLQALLDQPNVRWNAGSPIGSAVTLSFSFPDVLPPQYENPAEWGFEAFNETQKSTVREILAEIERATRIDFQEAAGVDAQIRFATVNLQGIGVRAFTVPQIDGPSLYGADIGLANEVFDNSTMWRGTAAYAAVMHEILHALGLKHPGNYDALGHPPPPPYLPSSQDNHLYTLMSYGNTELPHDSTPMPFDLAALQYLYGANNATAAGDDSYLLSSGAGRVAIWDAGGSDVIDASGQFGNVTVNLQPGSISYFGLLGASTPPLATLEIAFGVTIENAKGGWGNDYITGNASNNVLAGGAGADTLSGSAGNDVLDGGTGADTLIGGTGTDAYVVDNAGDVVVETSGEAGFDYIDAFVSRTLEANVEAMIMHSGANGIGNAQDNALYGNYDGAANILTGQDGNDIYNVGAGDVVVEASGAAAGSWDFINAYVSRTLEANVEAMIMLNGSNGTGNAQDNALYGNYDAAANVLTGMDGNDVYLLGAGDSVVEAPGGGSWDFMVSYVNHTLEANVEAMIMDGGSSGTGNAQDNALYGNYDAAANTLTGGDGNDVYNVGAGDVVVETPTGGTWDYIHAFVSRTLEANVEAMIMYNGATGSGNAQANTLYGNWDLSANLLIGGDGDDTYVVLAGDTVQESASQGTDTVVSFVNFVLPTNVENLSLSGTDPINATGNAQDNLILGNGADNSIAGGLGNDRLFGGGGVDRFVFDAAPNSAANVDVITDFVVGTDKLVLDHLIFTQLAVGNLQPGNLVAASGAFASQGDDHVLYDSTGGNLFYDSDGSGASAPVWLAHLDGNPALSAADFSVV